MRLRTAPFLAAVALALAVLTGCGSGDDAPKRTTPARATQDVLGTLYVVQLPRTWKNIGQQFDTAIGKPDTAWGDPRPATYKANFVVTKVRNADLQGKVIGQVDAEIRRETKPQKGMTTGPGTKVRLGGQDAIESSTTGTSGGTKVVRRQVLALYDGTLYSAALTAAEADTEAEATFRRLVATWKWKPLA